MRRVIFVDDEPRILQGLRRQLRPMRKEWDLSFAESGEEALRVMESSPFDVIVSDMRMPGMDGADLLARCKDRHPEIARVVLSGHMELERALRSIRLAHQFLTKPCDADTLRRVLTRTVDLQELLRHPSLRARLSGVDSVPVAPRTYLRLTEAVDDPDVSLEALAAIVETNPVLTAKLLQLVNSAFVGMSTAVSSLTAAIRVLGTKMLRNLVLHVEIAHALDESTTSPHFSSAAHERHALAVARIAREVAGRGAGADDAFTAGMLHDLGDLLMAVYLREDYDACHDEARTSGRDRTSVEYERLGFSHAEVGAYVLGLWGLPQAIVEAVAHHHRPERVREKSMDVVAAVHVADALAHELDPPSATIGFGTPLNQDFLFDILIEDRIGDWREQAARILGEVTAGV